MENPMRKQLQSRRMKTKENLRLHLHTLGLTLRDKRGNIGIIQGIVQRNRGSFPTFEVRYEEHEQEELLALEKPKKKKNKGISQVWCNNCKELGHYVSIFPNKI